jgi:hypothetical protein
MIIYNHYQITSKLRDLQDQKSQTLCCYSFSKWGRKHAPIPSFYQGDQCFIYDCLQPITTQIAQDARPKIVGALLVLIFKIG